jgi:hypothetical protein
MLVYQINTVRTDLHKGHNSSASHIVLLVAEEGRQVIEQLTKLAGVKSVALWYGEGSGSADVGTHINNALLDCKRNDLTYHRHTDPGHGL